MYYVSKKLEIAASHHLTTEPPTKCSRLHGHNYKVEIFCRSEELDANGMVTDFGLIKARVYDMLDHRDLNEVLPFNPTSENIARWICGQVPGCYKVSVQETRYAGRCRAATRSACRRQAATRRCTSRITCRGIFD